MEKKLSAETLELLKDLQAQCIGGTKDGKDVCKKCMAECKMMEKYTDCPKTLLEEAVENEGMPKEIPYSCNMCRACTLVCPKGLELREGFMALREDLTENNQGKSPIKGHGGIEMHQKLSFSKMFNTVNPHGKGGRRVFMPGCSLPSYSPELVRNITEYLSREVEGLATVLKCCGKPTGLMGQKPLFEQRYESLRKEFQDLGAGEVIVACQNCYNIVEKHSPDLKVTSLWTLLDEIGLPEEAKGIGKDSDLTFAIHDSCPTRNVPEIHQSIRNIMGELGYSTEELNHNKEKTRCCGMGGMVGAADFELAKSVMVSRGEEAKSEHMLVYCASCRDAMAIAGKKPLHILDLIFGGPYHSNREISTAMANPLKNWTNRYKSKKAIEKAAPGKE